MSRTCYLLMLSLMLPVAMADTTGDDFWKNCPGPACPANVPNRDSNAYKQHGDKYKQMDKKQLEQEREFHENAIKEIQRKERQLY